MRFIVILLNIKAGDLAVVSVFRSLGGCAIGQHRVWLVIVFLIILRFRFRKNWTGLVVVLLF